MVGELERKRKNVSPASDSGAKILSPISFGEAWGSALSTVYSVVTNSDLSQLIFG